MAKTPKTMIELINEDEDEEEITEDVASVATSEKSEKSSNVSAIEISHEEVRENGEELPETPEKGEGNGTVPGEEVTANGHKSAEDYENETFEYESNFEVEIRSTPPSNLTEGVHLFNVSLLNSALDGISFPPMRRKLFKNGTRQNLTFTNDQMWEIERQNRHLMERIFHPSGSSMSLRTDAQSNSRTASAAINRKKRDRQIQLDNQVLHRKLQAIKSRRPK